MNSIWQAALEELNQGRDFVFAFIIGVRGSSPRHIGTRLLVRSDGSIAGTIGGGLFEARVIKLAADALADRSSRRVEFSFTGQNAVSTEMICGGEVEVLIEYVSASDPAAKAVFARVADLTERKRPVFLFTKIGIPPEGTISGSLPHLVVDDAWKTTGGFPGEHEVVAATPQRRLIKPAQILTVPALEFPVFLECLHPRGTAFIFGGGHVGICVAHLAAYVEFRVVVIDDRVEFSNLDRIPDANETVVLESFDRAFDDLPVDDESYVIIVTRGHAHDKTVLEAALRTKAGYIGMIGSRRKTRLILDSLLKQGFTQEDLDRVYSPIGLPIGGETPEEIAVSIVAQMIQIRDAKAKNRT